LDNECIIREIKDKCQNKVKDNKMLIKEFEISDFQNTKYEQIDRIIDNIENEIFILEPGKLLSYYNITYMINEKNITK